MVILIRVQKLFLSYSIYQQQKRVFLLDKKAKELTELPYEDRNKNGWFLESAKKKCNNLEISCFGSDAHLCPVSQLYG